MITKPNFKIYFICIVIIIIVCLFLTSCSKVVNTKIWSPASKKDFSINGFHLVQTESGKKTIKMDADTAEIYRTKKTMKASPVKVIRFGKDGEVFSNLTSDVAFINMESNDIEFQGNVIVIGKDGSKVETEKLLWHANTNRFTSEEPVKVTKGNNIMTGQGIDTDVELNNLIMHTVKTTVKSVKALKVKDAKK
ncbi:MAG: LPS export ABC transporter periplasmic protein LptC [Candidatus Firestonebacteria bacterium]